MHTFEDIRNEYYNLIVKILNIVNLKSGLKNSKHQLFDVFNVFSKYGHTSEIYVTQKHNDAYEYLIKNKKKYDIVCVYGGDGTINEVSNALMKKKIKPLIGYFPSGTMNDFGSNFNLGSNWEDIAERICNYNVSEFDVGNVNGYYFNYVAAFGAFCDVPFSTNRQAKEAIGNLAYMFEGLSKLPNLKPIPIKITVKGKAYKYKALFGLIFSGNRVAGIEFINKKKGKINDGLFNILIVDYVKTPLIETPDFLETLARQDKHFHWFSAKEIEIEFEKNVVWTLDGEEATFDNKVKIINEHKALRILS